MIVRNFRELEKVADELLRSFYYIEAPGASIYREENDKAVVELEVPGVKREDIKVTGKQDTVQGMTERFTGIVVKWKDRKGQDCLRSYYLPQYNIDKTEVFLKDGILTIEVPKKTTGRSRDFPIK